jgi:hypothetical protein
VISNLPVELALAETLAGGPSTRTLRGVNQSHGLAGDLMSLEHFGTHLSLPFGQQSHRGLSISVSMIIHTGSNPGDSRHCSGPTSAVR